MALFFPNDYSWLFKKMPDYKWLFKKKHLFIFKLYDTVHGFLLKNGLRYLVVI